MDNYQYHYFVLNYKEVSMKQSQHTIPKLLAIFFLTVISLCFSSKADAKVTTELRNNGNIFKVTGTGNLNIATDVRGVEESYLLRSNTSISKITVSKNNKYLASKNGVLYNKKMTKLIWYPSNKKASSFKVPDTVKSISNYAFANSRYLQKVNLNNQLSEINEGAFKNSSIKSINIPYSVKHIGRECFKECGNLETVDNESDLSEIYAYTFSNCTSLKELNIGSSVEKISEYAFKNCGAMFNVATSNKHYISKDGVLYSKDMKELVKYPGLKNDSYIMPASVQSISIYAFTECINLKKLTLSENITEFPLDCLNGCSSLEVLNLPEKLEHIDDVYDDTVYGLSSLKEINLPEQNKYFKIYDNALYSADYKCLWLIPFAKTSLDIHEDTELIFNKGSQNKFDKITVSDTSKFFTSYKGVLYDKDIKSIEIFPDMLTNYEIPKTLKNASSLVTYTILDENDYAIGCRGAAPNLKSITVESGNKYFKSENGCLFNSDMTKFYAFPRAKKGKYVMPASTKDMNADAFAGARYLTELTVSSDMRYVGINLVDCDLLRKITFKEGIEIVYLYAGSATDENRFTSGLNIRNIYLPSTIDGIGIYAINDSAIFHAYDNTGAYKIECSDYEFIEQNIKSIKDYLINKSYIFHTRGAAPEKVKNISASWKNNKISVSWKPVKNADGYLIYIASNKTYKKLKDVKKTTTSVTIKSNKYIPRIYIKAYKNINNKRVYGKRKQKWISA